SAGAHGAKKTKVIFITSVIGALINILVNLIFIPIIGLYAVGLSTTIAFFVTWLIRVAEARQYFPIKIKPFEFISLLCLIAIINSAPFLLNIRTLVILSVLTIGFGLGLNFKMVWNRLKYLRQ